MRFIKEQEARALISNLRLEKPSNKFLLTGDVLF